MFIYLVERGLEILFLFSICVFSERLGILLLNRKYGERGIFFVIESVVNV